MLAIRLRLWTRWRILTQCDRYPLFLLYLLIIFTYLTLGICDHARSRGKWRRKRRRRIRNRCCECNHEAHGWPQWFESNGIWIFAGYKKGLLRSPLLSPSSSLSYSPLPTLLSWVTYLIEMDAFWRWTTGCRGGSLRERFHLRDYSSQELRDIFRTKVLLPFLIQSFSPFSLSVFF